MLRRVLLLAIVVAASLAVAATPAGADCSGPMLLPIEPAAPGEVITIEGHAFGDNCYDTGPPPDGQGVLGVPVADIELSIAGDAGEVVVARGSADAHYEFSVEVEVPPRMAPGTARVIARWGDDRSTEQTFEVLDEPPVIEPHGTTPVEAFGPADPTVASTSTPPVAGPTATTSDEGDERSPALVAAGAAAVIAVAAAAGTVAVRRRRARG